MNIKNYLFNSYLFVLLLGSSLVFAENKPADLDILKPDMAYMDARSQLIKKGWSPFLYGFNNPKEALSGCLDNGSSAYCEALPEIEDCSGDGYCMMIFDQEGSDQQLFISTYGDMSPENRNTDMNITGWRMEKWIKTD